MLINVAGGLLLAWIALVIVLAIARPRGGLPSEAPKQRYARSSGFGTDTCIVDWSVASVQLW
ncbi:hypothetical protein [Amycolatopsis saalfeldensis]|uniref:hypothetical protein n=1 Tax=Amycolatopsis saalfeldensis TaxID=394193 RepID=UPI0011606E58|nr:hypothetical protein [Amycolatopsis saalfeldensis]